MRNAQMAETQILRLCAFGAPLRVTSLILEFTLLTTQREEGE